MRIAMLGQKGFPAESGGVEQSVEMLSRHLVQRGHEVVVYCRRSYRPEGVSSRESGLQCVYRPSIATKHLDAITHTLAGTIDILLRRADVVHYHAIGPAALAPLARLGGMPVVVSVQGLDWQRAKWGPMAQRCLKFAQWSAVRCANQLVAVSPSLRDYFTQQLGVAAHFVPNGVVPIPYREASRIREFGLNPRNFLLSVARLVPEKGLHYLIEAFCRTRHDVQLVIAGGSGFDRAYEKKLLGMADSRVIFTGPADRELLAELYSHALMFVLPSDLEGMSLALLEAMSMGLPVLVSDIPENTGVVEDSGFSFRQGDVDDLRRKLDELLADPSELAAWGSKAAARADIFRWPAIVDQMEQIYASCIGRPIAPAYSSANAPSTMSDEPALV